MKFQTQFNPMAQTGITEVSPDRPVTQSRTWLEVGDVMNEAVQTVSSTQTVVETARMMAEANISCVVVVDEDKVTGVLTETDLLKRGVVEAGDIRKLKVADVMTSPIMSIPAHTSVLEAGRMMDENNIRRLPILEDGKLVGIVTQTDMIRVLTTYGMWRDVAEIMSRDVSSATKDATIAQAAEVMASRNISSTAVVEGDSVVGVFTERDMLKRIIAVGKDPHTTRLEEVMSSPVVAVSADCSVLSASKVMENNKIRRLIVMDNGQLCGILSQTDIFMAVKNKLQDDEEKHLGMLERSESCVYTLDLDGRITYANPALLRLLEVADSDELIGHRFLPECFQYNSSDAKSFFDLTKDQGPQRRELTLRSTTGKKIYATLFADAIKGPTGRVDGSQGILHDITAEKELVALRQTQEALAQSNAETEEVNLQLADAVKKTALLAKEAQAACRAKSDFLAKMSHEIRTPMNAIIGFGDLLVEEQLTEEQKHYVETIRSSSRHLLNLIDDILDFSKIEAGKLEIHPVDCDLMDILSEVETILHPLATNKNLEFKVLRSTALPVQIHTDPNRLKQCLINLANNAIKFTEKGHVHLTATSEPDQAGRLFLKFDVVDTGIGIDQDKQTAIFDSFVQVDNTSTRQFEGTGLGLAITKQLAELLGGTVSLSSQLGRGSTFTLTIPAETAPQANF